MNLINSELGKISPIPTQYDNSLLFPIARHLKRKEIGIEGTPAFHGHDLWNAYEISWLNTKCKPISATGQFIIPSKSPFLIESKSLKLYLNSFSQTQFHTENDVCQTIEQDLTRICKTPVSVTLFTGNQHPMNTMPSFWDCIDNIDIVIDEYKPNKKLLKTSPKTVRRNIFSNLLKSNCPVTNQPDWGSLFIEYKGNDIVSSSLLQYIISFRCHTEFHEQCVERIFTDIMNECAPESLTVFAKYTRRGGLDINPVRSNEPHLSTRTDFRLNRQ